VRVLSVDLGTSNTVAVLSAHGRPPRVVEVDGSATMPSAVFAAEDGGLTVGREAERKARLDPARFEPNPKRRVDEGTLLLGDAVVPVTDALAAVLKRVADETSRQLGGAKPDEARLTHPAQWGPVRRTVLLSAARQAGLSSTVTLVPEPVAAAAHFASFPGQTLSQGQALAVYDLGAGTFDVAVIGVNGSGFTVLAEAGLPDLGGLDVDQALLEHVGRQVSHREPSRWQRLLRPETTGDRRAQRALREDVKAAKEALSSHQQTEVPMPEPFEDVLVTRSELESLVRPNLLRSVELLAGTVRSAGAAPDRLAGIYLVGGSSRIPLVATLIAEQLKVVPTTLDQPETAVALGAHQTNGDGTGRRVPGVDSTVALGEEQPTVSLNGGARAKPQGGTRPPSYPPSRPNPVFLPTGPRPAGQPPAHPPGPPPRFAPHPYPQPAAATRSRKKPLLIAAGAFVLVAAAVIGIVVATSGGGGEPNDPGSPTGASIAGGGRSGNCAGQQAESDGFTDCLRELAGSVPDTFTCTPGMRTDTSGTPLNYPGATIVTCKKSDYVVYYWQLPSDQQVQQTIDLMREEFGGAEVTPEDWEGGGLAGKYYNYEIGYGAGIGIFTVTGKPLLGMLTNASVSTTGTSSSRSGATRALFQDEIKPG
jgi:actin-like ATPase involved in cell morphogenesis